MPATAKPKKARRAKCDTINAQVTLRAKLSSVQGIEPPYELSAAAKAIFDETIVTMPFETWDAHRVRTAASYASKMARAEKLQFFLEENGDFYTDVKGESRERAELGAELKLTKAAQALARSLGLTSRAQNIIKRDLAPLLIDEREAQSCLASPNNDPCLAQPMQGLASKHDRLYSSLLA